MKKIIIIAVLVVCSMNMFSQTTQKKDDIDEIKNQITEIQKIREDVITSKETYPTEKVVIVFDMALIYARAYVDLAIEIDSLTKQYNALIEDYNKLVKEIDK